MKFTQISGSLNLSMSFVLLEQCQILSFQFAPKAATIHIPIQLQEGVHPGYLCAVSRDDQWQAVI